MTLMHQGRTLHLNRCIVDTGSAGTIVEADQVGTIGLTPAPESKIRFIAAVGGKESVYTRRVDRVVVAGEAVADFEIEIGDVRSPYGMDGIIGNDLLERFRLEICYHTKQLRLQRATPLMGLCQHPATRLG